MTATNQLTLHNGVEIPQLGLGVFQVPPGEVQQLVELALEVGYRHIDTAAAYNNEAGVGAGLRASGLPRDEVFITSKLRNGEQGYDSALKAHSDSLERLGIEAMDLYLVHWPNPAAGLYVDSWRALERLYNEKAVRAVGVSNFLPEHLDEIAKHSELLPTVNQIELHPTFQQLDVVADTLRRGIVVQSYSPLGRGQDLDNPVIQEIAAAHGATPAQAILRWHLQRGYVVIPKSNNPERLKANLDVTGFELTDEQLAAIDGLDDSDARIGGHPATFAQTQIR